ncbi:MAG: HPr kinase/phosphorylase [Alphaproteobacteria bacterium]
MNNIHASCISIDNNGVLIIGKSGSGKSDLALRLIDNGAELVADDRCEVFADNNKLLAQAPSRIKGLIEVRGIGIIKLPFVIKSEIKLVVELQEKLLIDRMPDADLCHICGLDIPKILLYPFENSAIIKVKLALAIAANKIEKI